MCNFEKNFDQFVFNGMEEVSEYFFNRKLLLILPRYERLFSFAEILNEKVWFFKHFITSKK